MYQPRDAFGRGRLVDMKHHHPRGFLILQFFVRSWAQGEYFWRAAADVKLDLQLVVPKSFRNPIDRLSGTDTLDANQELKKIIDGARGIS